MASMRTDTIKFLTLEETTRLLNGLASHRRDKAIFLLAYRHGLRASEVGLLRVEDLDFKTLRIMIHRLKGSHSGEHPLQADEAKAIKAYLRERRSDSPILFTSNRGDPIARRTLDWLMKKHGAGADLPLAKQHFHCPKHSIGTHLLDVGADLRFVQDWGFLHIPAKRSNPGSRRQSGLGSDPDFSQFPNDFVHIHRLWPFTEFVASV